MMAYWAPTMSSYSLLKLEIQVYLIDSYSWRRSSYWSNIQQNDVEVHPKKPIELQDLGADVSTYFMSDVGADVSANLHFSLD